MRLIDADTFEVVITKIPDGMDTESYVAGMDFVLNKIDDAPTIEERKTGKWIEDGIWTDMYTADEIPIFKCSVCENEVLGTGGFDYCPNCGAKMEKEK